MGRGSAGAAAVSGTANPTTGSSSENSDRDQKSKRVPRVPAMVEAGRNRRDSGAIRPTPPASQRDRGPSPVRSTPATRIPP